MMKPFPVSQFTFVAVISLFVLTAAASSLAQEQQEQEDSRAIRTREFLGLGRMPDAKMAAEGARIFGPTCGFCHGADARVGSASDLLRSAGVLDYRPGVLRRHQVLAR